MLVKALIGFGTAAVIVCGIAWIAGLDPWRALLAVSLTFLVWTHGASVGEQRARRSYEAQQRGPSLEEFRDGIGKVGLAFKEMRDPRSR